MKVLILGGTGTMGRYLVDILSNRNTEITVTSRMPHVSDRKNITYLCGNAHEISFLHEVLSECRYDAVVDFMIYTSTEFSERFEYILQNTEQYVFLSSSRVYADSEGAITEQSDRLIDKVDDPAFIASEKYAISKAKQENMLSKSPYNNYTIIRPYITYGSGRFQLGIYEKEDWLYRVIHGRSIVFSKDIADKLTTLTYAHNVSAGIASLIGNRTAYGEAFHITCNYPLKWNEILETYKKVLDKRGYNTDVVYANYASEIINRDEQVKYDRAYNRIFNNQKIGKYLNVEDFAHPDDGLELCLNEFLDNPHFKNINWITQARMDKFAKENTSLSEIPGIKNKLCYLFLRFFVDYKTIKKIMRLRSRIHLAGGVEKKYE